VKCNVHKAWSTCHSFIVYGYRSLYQKILLCLDAAGSHCFMVYILVFGYRRFDLHSTAVPDGHLVEQEQATEHIKLFGASMNNLLYQTDSRMVISPQMRQGAGRLSSMDLAGDVTTQTISAYRF
jgi:hypothetical protein